MLSVFVSFWFGVVLVVAKQNAIWKHTNKLTHLVANGGGGGKAKKNTEGVISWTAARGSALRSRARSEAAVCLSHAAAAAAERPRQWSCCSRAHAGGREGEERCARLLACSRVRGRASRPTLRTHLQRACLAAQMPANCSDGLTYISTTPPPPLLEVWARGSRCCSFARATTVCGVTCRRGRTVKGGFRGRGGSGELGGRTAADEHVSELVRWLRYFARGQRRGAREDKRHAYLTDATATERLPAPRDGSVLFVRRQNVREISYTLRTLEERKKKHYDDTN